MRNIHFLLLGLGLIVCAALYSSLSGPFQPTLRPATAPSVIEAGIPSVPVQDKSSEETPAPTADRFNFAVEHLPVKGATSLQKDFDAGRYNPPFGQDSLPKLTWQMLRDVKYKEKWNEAEQMHFNYPVFGTKVKALAGREFYVTGYMIPLDAKGGLYAVSANPYAACYFCGQSGPETIVSIKFSKPPKRYKTDDIVNIRGTLRLNDTDVNDFIYIFERASDYDAQ